MSYISLGEFDKKMIYPLIAGISKLVVNIILYFYENDVKLNNHPFVLGINAGFGMSLAIIPYIYFLISTKKLGKENMISNNPNDDKYIDELFQKNDPIVKKEKYLFLFLCAFLDLVQKILVFIFSYRLPFHFWIINIIFLNLFTSLLTKNPIYRHQYCSSGLMILFGILLNLFNFKKITLDNISLLVINLLIEIIFSLAIVLAKYGMDNLFCSPFEITFYEGILCLILNIIFLMISSNIPIPFEKAIVCKVFFKISDYNGKQYLDNFHSYINELQYKEVLLFLVGMFGRLIFNLFSHITIKHFTSCHVALILLVGEIILDWKNKEIYELVFQGLFFLVEFVMILVFLEIIELHFCGFDKNTTKNIKERAETAIYDEIDGNWKDNEGGNETDTDKSSSVNNNDVETI